MITLGEYNALVGGKGREHRDHQPDVHEAESTDVGGVCVVEEPHHLFACEAEGVEFVQDAEGGGNDTPCTNTSHLNHTQRGRFIINTITNTLG